MVYLEVSNWPEVNFGGSLKTGVLQYGMYCKTVIAISICI